MTDRTTYDFLDMIGDCGGVLEISLVFFSMLTAPVALKQLKAHITNRMFTLSSNLRTSILGNIDLTDKKVRKEHMLLETKNGDYYVDVPPLLDLHYLRYMLFYSCCPERTKRFEGYRKLIRTGHETFEEDLDLIRMSQRMRMHGAALYYLLNRSEEERKIKKLSVLITQKRHLRQRKVIDEDKKRSWESIENIEFWDRF